MTKQTMHPLAEQYLEELRRATSGIPRAQQAELLEDIQAHLEAGLAIAETEADVRNLLESLGTPDAAVAALEVTPARPPYRHLPLVLGLLSMAIALYGINALVHPVRAVASIALGLAALVIGVRMARDTRVAVTRSWGAIVGAAFGGITLLAVTISWAALIAFDGGGRAIYVGPVTEVSSPTQVVSTTNFQIRAVLEVDRADVADCSAMAALATDPATEMSACSADDTTLYRLAPAAVTGASVRSVAAVAGSATDQSVLQVVLSPAGQASLAALSGELVGQPDPQSRMAIVILGEVFDAPTVTDQLSPDILQVALPLTLQQTQVLVGQLLGSS